MLRPTWRGAISFGLVNVPVQLITAVRPKNVRFRQLQAGTNRPIRQIRVDPETGDEVPYENIVKGYEVSEDRYVVVEPSELEELDPKASRSIDIEDYVEQAEIDPVYYDRAYYLAPDGETAAKPYRLLAEAMERAGKVAVARFVMRDKQYLAAIRARDGMLVLSTMHYHDEVADPGQLGMDELLSEVDVRDREVQMAEQLIASMTTEFDPTAYSDEHRERILDYLEAKAEGEQVELPGAERERGEVIDLMEALERSLDRAREDGSEDVGGSAAAPRAADYDAMTRDELYELAQQRGTPGRSSMSKGELAAALRASDADTGAA